MGCAHWNFGELISSSMIQALCHSNKNVVVRSRFVLEVTICVTPSLSTERPYSRSNDLCHSLPIHVHGIQVVCLTRWLGRNIPLSLSLLSFCLSACLALFCSFTHPLRHIHSYSLAPPLIMATKENDIVCRACGGKDHQRTISKKCRFYKPSDATSRTTCASCGQEGHMRNSHKDCPNNSRNRYQAVLYIFRLNDSV